MKKTDAPSNLTAINLASLAKGLRSDSAKHTSAASRASKSGNVTDTAYHCGIATVLSEIADRFEQEAGK